MAASELIRAYATILKPLHYDGLSTAARVTYASQIYAVHEDSSTTSVGPMDRERLLNLNRVTSFIVQTPYDVIKPGHTTISVTSSWGELGDDVPQVIRRNLTPQRDPYRYTQDMHLSHQGLRIADMVTTVGVNTVIKIEPTDANSIYWTLRGIATYALIETALSDTPQTILQRFDELQTKDMGPSLVD